jgi:hypothetical protein
MFGLKYPTYGLTLNLRLSIKNHGAEADLADALVTQRGDHELALVQAQTGYQTAVAGIDHAIGKLLERHQVKLVPPHN